MNTRTKDVLGYRAVIGAIVPTTNTIVQPELDDMRPNGVTNHISRIEPSSLGLKPGDLDAYAKRLERSSDHIYRGIDDLVPCKPDLIILAHSVNSFHGGVNGAKSLKEDLEKRSGGIPVTLASLAFLEAIDCLKVGKRISALTPFWDPGDAQVLSFLEEAGYDVIKIKGLKCHGPLAIAAVDEHQLKSALSELAQEKPNVIIQPGTNLASARFADEASRWLGVPILACNSTIYWSALRSLGILDRKDGFGPLLRDY